MKKLFTLLLAFSFATGIFSQVPEKMNYQSVIRDASNNLVTDQAVGMQISILQGTADGSPVYVETQTPTSNGNGLVSIEIGAGTVVSGDFTTIDWTNGPYFIKTETDPDGGSTYSIIGTSQLLSVPYALHSGTSDALTGEITESQISDLQAYYPASNPDGFISDYIVTEEDVTAHQGALEITESQITDLDHFTTADETDPAVAANFDFTDAVTGDLLKFDGTKWAKVTPDYISDYTVTEDDVTAHEAALTVSESQISDLGTYIEAETDPTVTTYSVGDFAQGGIVFWVDETGQHGLVCAKEDQDGGNGIQWNLFNGSYTNTEAHGDGFYAGEMNTILIIAKQGYESNDYAAGVCANYLVTESGVTYGDWYLPSKEELNLMYQNRATIDATATTNGGSAFASAYYWSSTEHNSQLVWNQHFSLWNQWAYFKDNTYRVRAVRAF